MKAAIQCLENTLLIRRLQAREFSHEKDGTERIAAINEDIASLERGLQALQTDGKQKTPDSDRMLIALQFIATMLEHVVVVEGYKANFSICEAREVAKEYLPSSVSPGSPTIGDPAQKPLEAS